MRRYLVDIIAKDLERKMVFLAGPRQVGKTTIARSLLSEDLGYMNWDTPEGREQILKRQFPASPILVFDELHKYRGWRNYLKGIFDSVHRRSQILVTGSARLDYYSRGGDSLQGRYHLLRLHPLSVAELRIDSDSALEHLLKRGGFPEPYFASSEEEARRWVREYRTLIVREEVTDLERVTDLGKLELLVMRLPELVGSPLSLNALREDLEVSHKTVSRWIEVLERLYVLFRLAPFGSSKIKAVKKERKHYHYDWSVVEDLGARFENLVGSHLLKWIHYQQDVEGRDLDLQYLRDQSGREIDFVITEKRKPITFIECKLSAREISKSLRYFQERFPETEAIQVVEKLDREYLSGDGIRVVPALQFLSTLV